MRRFAAAGTQARPDRLRTAPGDGTRTGPRQTIDGGVRGSLAGRSLAGLPHELADALANYSDHSITLGLRQGKPEAVAEALSILADDAADRSKQLQLLQILGEVRRPACVPVVLHLACQSADNALRTAALARSAALRRADYRRPRCSSLIPTCPMMCWPPPRARWRRGALGRPVSRRHRGRDD